MENFTQSLETVMDLQVMKKKFDVLTAKMDDFKDIIKENPQAIKEEDILNILESDSKLSNIREDIVKGTSQHMKYSSSFASSSFSKLKKYDRKLKGLEEYLEKDFIEWINQLNSENNFADGVDDLYEEHDLNWYEKKYISYMILKDQLKTKILFLKFQ